ncbi:MAG: phosphatase PAP2 family protein [Ignavibacteriae bacterium]|nr:phosphatase PAP2 family protein [Ignavibacteriota bacterium]
MRSCSSVGKKAVYSITITMLAFGVGLAGDDTLRVAMQDSVAMRIDSPSDSQSLISTPTPKLKWYTMFERIPGDWATWWNTTFREDKIPAMLAVTALTAATIVTDQPTWDVSDYWYKRSRVVKDVSDVFVYLGDGKPQFGLAAAYGLYGWLANDERALLTASQITEVILACGTVIQVMKHITGRESPFVSTRTNGRWVFFPNQIEYHKKVPHYDAYPSGHIATALATLTVVLENYPELKPWLQPIGYFVVGMIGVGMMTSGIHWWSDYPLGLVLGYQFGMIASHPEGLEVAKSPDDATPKLSLSPSISPISKGLRVSLQF